MFDRAIDATSTVEDFRDPDFKVKWAEKKEV
jgi:hypothetical protein